MARNDRIRRTFTPQFKKDAVALKAELAGMDPESPTRKTTKPGL